LIDFPHNGSLCLPDRTLYAYKDNLSIYSRHIGRLVEYSISTVFGVSPYEIRSKHRRRENVAFARQVAMYLAHTSGGISLSEVGRIFARDRTTVAHACAVVEDMRDDPAFDRCLAFLEIALISDTHSRADDGREAGR
jgi:hypothetical protein